MHINLIISSLNSGGAERALSDLANHLILKQYQVTIIMFAAPQNLIFYKLSPQINIIQIGQLQNLDKDGFVFWCNKFNFLSYLIRFKNILKRIIVLRKTICYLTPDLIISFVDITNITTIIATLGLKIPLIVSERTNPFYHRIPKLYQRLRRWLYPMANYIVMQTEAAALYFKDIFPVFNTTAHNAANLIVIPNAVRKPCNKKEFLLQNVNRAISIGRLCPYKGFDTLIRAFAKIINYFPDLTLTIYGEGDERSNLENLIKSLNMQNRIFLPGVTKNVEEALISSDLFVFPSHYEGFPNALTEAMAAGLPVIASNCCGNVDLVVDRVNGCLFPVGDVDALATVMQELLGNFELRSKLSLATRKIVEQFSEDRIYAKWQEIIDCAKTIRSSHN